MDKTRPAVTPASADGIDRRSFLRRGGIAAAGVIAGAPLVAPRSAGAATDRHGGDAPRTPKRPRPTIPPETRPGGAYDRYVAKLAAEGKFSGVVLLSHEGRTVLSRSYGMADRERGIPNRESTAVYLSSASQPFLAVAVLQLLQQGRLALSDTVGTHLKGFARPIAERVDIHQMLTATAGLSAPPPDTRRTFRSREEVLRYNRSWTRRTKLVTAPGSTDENHTDGGGAALSIAAQIVEAVSGMTYWDYVRTHVFDQAGMTGSGFFTTPQWVTDDHIAQNYMEQPGGGSVDAARNLDKDSLSLQGPHENPGRNFIGYGPGGGFATAPDLVRFGRALLDGTLLDRPYADLLWQPKLPGPIPSAFAAYTLPVAIVKGPQWEFGRGGATGGSGANWTVYPDTGWVGVVLTNTDIGPFPEILLRERHAVTGEPIGGAAGGGGG